MPDRQWKNSSELDYELITLFLSPLLLKDSGDKRVVINL